MKEKICGYYLDKDQEDIVLDNSKYLLVLAGAGSGKTLTIIGKINYLIKYKNISPSEILCLSFTRKTVNSLKTKIFDELKVDMPIYTFHKLALEILKDCNYQIAESNSLELIVDKFFNYDILKSNLHMKLVLNYFNIYIFIDCKNTYIKFINHNDDKIKTLKRLVITFIHLFKCNNYCLSDFLKILKKSRSEFLNLNYRNEKALLNIILNVYIMYQEELAKNNLLDFDDMILKAINCLKENKIKSFYKYIIIDEYQDVSYVRFNLVRQLLELSGANLMVVGDDFQSIYRFAGCDLSLFLNFHKYFYSSKTMKIRNTYRNSQELINAAGNFVLKNKNQIPKKLISNKHIDKPIKIIYYTNLQIAFNLIVDKIYSTGKKSILVLGRNNNDISFIVNKNWKLINNQLINNKYKDANIKFLTVHKSKGLEDEVVVILNLKNSILGFPSQIKNEKILRFVINNSDDYLYAEERRLFYVALTRTKESVYLLVPTGNESVFVKELIYDNKSLIEFID